MMNVQLLLLLALAGPFCAFTHASPTALPDGITEASEGDLGIFTGPPATEPALAPEEVVTEGVAATKAAEEEVTSTEEAVATEVVTEAAPPAVTVNTEAAVVETDAPAAATAGPEPLITNPPVVETAAPTEPAEDEVHSTGAAKAETDGQVVVEDPEEGQSSGQVVGIVIGALLAVIIVIAVVIAVVRRMGKYSSAKNKKTAKKDMVSPLKRKSAKQQERPKFWKF